MTQHVLGKTLFHVGNPVQGVKNATMATKRSIGRIRHAPRPRFDSFPSNMLYNLYLEEKNSTTFQNAKKNLLKKYTVKEYGNIGRRNIKDPENMQKEIDDLIKKFMTDFRTFLNSFTKVFYEIIAVLDVAQQEHYKDLKYVEEIMSEAEALAEKKPEMFFVPKLTRVEFVKEFQYATKDLERQLKRTYDRVRNMSRGLRGALGYWSRFARKRTAEKKVTQIAAHITAEIKKLKDAHDILQGQLNEGKIKLNFLAYLIQYIQQLEKVDHMFKNLMSDLEVIIDKVIMDGADTIDKITGFLEIIKNEFEQQEHFKIKMVLAEYYTTQNKALLQLQREDAWPVHSEKALENLKGKAKQLNAILKDIQEHKMPEQIKRRLAQSKSSIYLGKHEWHPRGEATPTPTQTPTRPLPPSPARSTAPPNE